MCGLFGYSGTVKADPTRLRILADKSRDRGEHSLGFFGNGQILKSADDYDQAIFELDIESICDKEVLGHNRYATMGKHTTENAHPFQFDGLVGTHNGFVLNLEAVKAKFKYDHAIDSQHVLNIIAEHGIDAIQHIEGPLALAYVKDERLHLISRSKWLHVGWLTEKKMYYSSEIEPLRWIGISDKNIYQLPLNVLHVYKEGKLHDIKHIAPPKLEFDVVKSEPKLYTWRSHLTEETKHLIDEAVDGKFKEVKRIERATSWEWDKEACRWIPGDQYKGRDKTQSRTMSKQVDKTSTDFNRGVSQAQSVIFDDQAGYNLFGSLKEIKALPKNELKQVVENSKGNGGVGCHLTVKVMSDLPNGEVMPQENVVVKVADTPLRAETNSEGIAVIPVPNEYASYARRLYFWTEKTPDDKPYYTKMVELPNAVALEVAAILPIFQGQEETEEESYETLVERMYDASNEYPDHSKETGYYDEWEDFRRWDDCASGVCGFSDATTDAVQGSEDNGFVQALPGSGTTAVVESMDEKIDRLRKEVDDEYEEAAMRVEVNKAKLEIYDLEIIIEDVEQILHNDDSLALMSSTQRSSLNKIIDLAYGIMNDKHKFVNTCEC